jgi:tetratricopeptide (TPR) repeat protein
MKRILVAGMLLAALSLATMAQNTGDWPRIMVVLDEKVDGAPTDARLVAAKIEETLLDKGFRLVDKAQFQNVQARDIAVAEGNPARAKEIGMRYGAELIIVGKAEGNFESEKEFYGIKNFEYAAKGDCRVIITDTGELIAVSAKTTKKSAGGRSSAADLSLTTLGETLATDLYVKIRMKLKEEASGSRIVQLALIGFDQKAVSQYERNLPHEIQMITQLKLRYFEKEAAVFEATINGTMDDLRDEFTKRQDVIVVAFTGTRLDISTPDFADKAKGTAIMTSALDITQFTIENIFPSQVNYYAYNPLAKIEVENSAKTEIRNVKVSIFIPDYMSLPSEQIVPQINAGAKQTFNLPATLDAKQLFALSAKATAQAKVELSYVFNNQPQTRSLVKPVTLYNRNTINWKRGESVGAFVTPTDEAVVNFSRYVAGSIASNDNLNTKLPRNVANALAVWSAIRANGYNYVSASWTPSEQEILDQVAYPVETLSSHTGNCSATSVLMASCLENLGVRTKFLATEDHIYLMFDTDVLPKNGFMISQNDKEYIVNEETVWMPLEATMINKPFMEAWMTGAEEYYKYTGSGKKIEIIDTRKAMAVFPPANLSFLPAHSVPTPPADKIAAFVAQDLADYSAHQGQITGSATASLASVNTPEAKNKSAVIQAKAGDYDAAIATLAGVSTWQAENTLGNTFLLKNDLPAAQEHYQKSLDLNKEDGGVYLNFGLARYLSGSPEDASEAFQVAVSKFDSVQQAYEILGLGRLKETLGMRGADQSGRKISKNELFDLLSQSLKNVPDKQKSTSQAQRVREKYKDEQNRFVFGGRRGADPTQIASVKEFLYWKE